MPGSVRGLASRAVAPVLAQAITAATSLLLQVIAVWTLGLTAYGTFALLLGLLIGLNALYTGFVGDSLAVLDRHEPNCRASLVSGALLGWGACLAAAAAVSLLVRPDEPLVAAVYAMMVVVWLARETVRRLFIARTDFRSLVAGDACCLLVTVLVLLALPVVSEDFGLASLFGAMGAGSLAVVAVGLVRLPDGELRALRPGLAGMPELASFAFWRALQAGLRPLSLLTARLLVAGLVSLAAVGLLEAARLVVAPLQVVINGVSSFLLGGLAAREHDGGSPRSSATGTRTLLRCAVLSLVGGTVLVGGVLAMGAGPVGDVLIGRSVAPAAVLGWVAYLAVWAAAMPFATELVVRRMSRAVFRVRLADSLAGVGAAAAALLSGADPVVVPWVLAAAGLYSVGRLRVLVLRTTRPHPGSTVPGRGHGRGFSARRSGR